MPARRMARVLLDSPLPQLDRLFDYALPDTLTDDAAPGVRVRVPLRQAGRLLDGYIVECADETDDTRALSDVERVVSAVRVMPPSLYRLVRACADRAAGGAADILRLVVPRRMVRAEKACLRQPPPAAPAVPPATQGAAHAVLARFPGLAQALQAGARVAVDAAPGLTRTPQGADVGRWAALLAAAAAATLAGGRSAVLVVPDHRDQEQLTAALHGLGLGEAVVRADARQAAPERYAAYLRTLASAPCIVVGNRSAVYAPAHATGLVALWDDGDPLLAEPLSPGVHARDAALVRQELDGCALLLLGHTRSSDVQRLVENGWVRHVPPARRQAPRIVLSATREGEARGARVPSAAFAAAREALRTGPVLVQVARPGYAPTLVCAGCRQAARCLSCGGPLRAARPGAVPVCGWCGRAAAGWRCPTCDGDRWRMASSGSERTADELGRAFPDTPVIVADGGHIVLHVADTPALVVATRGAEPVARGGYRAVLLLDGDRMLQSDRLRIGESCLRWWSNAAALAAPGAPVHLVGVAGHIARALATWTQPAYAHQQLVERAPLHMPPAARTAVVDGAAADVHAALDAVRQAVPGLSADAVLGPVPQAGTDAVRAFLRFDYAHGAAVAASLRAAVVAAALHSRRRRGIGTPRNTLRVRVDVLDPDL